MLQSLVYSLLPQQEATFIHEEGFQTENRTYKLFCFSRLKGEKVYFDKRTKKLTFKNKIALSISSIIPDLIEKASNYLILSDYIDFHGQHIKAESIEFRETNVNTDTVIVKAMSPITTYSTFTRRNGQKITQYYAPKDPAFTHLIEENFCRKFKAYTGIEPEIDALKIKTIEVQQKHKVVTNYKGTWITGWTGKYKIQARPDYLSFAIATGLGAKNSIGFGMVGIEKTVPLRD